jgi:carboxymethylenebutenolidase
VEVPKKVVEFEVVESRASYESQAKTIAVERFEPKAEGKYPVVLVLHGAGGMTLGGPAFREFGRLLARHGYVAHVVHYFELTDTEIAGLPAMRANFSSWMKAISDGITNASKQPNVDPDRVGLLGFSLGSYLSLSLATFDPRVSVVVEYFGGLPTEIARDFKSLPPVLILHGDADKIVPITEADTLEKVFKEKSVSYEKRIYAGQGHGFTGEDGEDAARRAVAFFERHLRSRAAPNKARETLKSIDEARFKPEEQLRTGDELRRRP